MLISNWDYKACFFALSTYFDAKVFSFPHNVRWRELLLLIHTCAVKLFHMGINADSENFLFLNGEYENVLWCQLATILIFLFKQSFLWLHVLIILYMPNFSLLLSILRTTIQMFRRRLWLQRINCYSNLNE